MDCLTALLGVSDVVLQVIALPYVNHYSTCILLISTYNIKAIIQATVIKWQITDCELQHNDSLSH